MKVTRLFATAGWIDQNKKTLALCQSYTLVSSKELEQLSGLKSTREVIALVEIPEQRFDAASLKGLVPVLDGLQDPGNLGTLIRLADWYGIPEIVCSDKTVDCYNAKTIQATMGSIARVKVHYLNLIDWLLKIQLPVYASGMNGTPINELMLPKDMLLVIGNEGQGVNTDYNAYIHHWVSIERRGGAESLNAAMAGAILVDRYFGQHSTPLA